MIGIRRIELKTINDVKEFVEYANTLHVDVTLKSGSYVVDGKSIMGIFSLNLSDEVVLEFSDNITKEEEQMFSKWVID